MCSKYMISDCHFYNESVITRFDKRKFDSVSSMNEYMIRKWNNKVKDHDTVYILGDFSRGNGEETNNILKELKGNKILVVGNHDKDFLLDEKFDKNLFRGIHDYLKVNTSKKRYILSHYPIIAYERQVSKNTYMLHGHIHHTKDQELIDKFSEISKNSIRADGNKFPCNIINCFCMYSKYEPCSLGEWININKKRIELGTMNYLKEIGVIEG